MSRALDTFIAVKEVKINRIRINFEKKNAL